jgi:hypothetical protein
MDTLELFADLDLGRSPPGDGSSVSPIGRRDTTGRRRRQVRVRARRPSTAVVLAELRALMRHEFGNLVVRLRRIERAIGVQGERRTSDSETLNRLLHKLTAVERQLGLIEPPKASRVSRRRPLD